ncbi:metallophosphoesterase [Terracidiphilus gabretensis]|uniref:metallophosphoesterase n=1 Tax=Terracidiphilus gabretensis TaxID=1577687 RepID=UPI00071BCD06|nr:metallophosphoesterase [Terracidiphilus gabretensis]
MARCLLPSLKLTVLLAAALVFCGEMFAEPATAGVTALLVSDVHFEPFWDPAKVPQLAAAPASEWKTILAAPPSADQAQRFAALQQTCNARGVDTNYTLLASSLKAMRARAADAQFVTISGDLISHAFSCKWMAAMPNAKPAEYEAFVVKTLEYVLSSFRTEFPATPVYAALGNNDSSCGDYKVDANSSFLAAASKVFTEKLPATERKAAEETFAARGDFRVALPAPFEHTLLLILNDIFQSKKYQTCGGKTDSSGAMAQIAWLKSELDEARQKHEKIWVMGHIPPGVDPYTTISRMRNVCGGKDPEMFLSSDDLANTLDNYGDVIRLAIFGHTHMDEMRVVEQFPLNGKDEPVALKMVPSISPVNGNNPAFTIATVDPATATLRDYRVIAGSNQTGVDTNWSEEYDYAKVYHRQAFALADVEALADEFAADTGAKSAESRSYLRDYFVGDKSAELTFVWPQYTCALTNMSADAYRACRCPAK